MSASRTSSQYSTCIAGASWGTLRRPDALLRAARRLQAAGCTAIAVVARFPDDDDAEMLAAYRAGNGVDTLGGAEAIISHLVTKELRIPCAHAPAMSQLDLEPDLVRGLLWLPSAESASAGPERRAWAQGLGYCGALPC